MKTKTETTVSLTSQQISDLIVTAIEGGSNYWMSNFILIGHDANKGGKLESPWYSDPKLYESAFKIHADFIEDAGKKGKPITKKDITEADLITGFKAFVEKCPQHYADLISENWDATTADVFMQCIMFGEIIFG